MRYIKMLLAVVWFAISTVLRLLTWFVLIPATIVLTVVVLVIVGCIGYSAHNCYETIKGLK